LAIHIYLSTYTYTGCEYPQWVSHPVIAATQSMSSFLATLFNPGTARNIIHVFSLVKRFV